MSRPLLVGLHNPLSPKPEHALYPRPEGCTGWRLLRMLGPAYTERDYLRAFDRVDLLDHHEQVGGKGYAARLRRARLRLVEHIIAGRYETVVLFGADVWRTVIGIPNCCPPWLCWTTAPLWAGPTARMFRFLTLPHPSGRNRWYQDRVNAHAASTALRQLAVPSLAEARP